MKNTQCDRCNFNQKLNICDLLNVPFEIDHKELQKLLSYFLHLSPEISSVHSLKISPELHNNIFQEMMRGRAFKYENFCSSNSKISRELIKAELSGNKLCFKCKRFICKRRHTDKGQLPESNLSCFLRHIRNAIAHGRFYYKHTGNRVFIMFEDMNDQEISARIVCNLADLQHWKSVLSNHNTRILFAKAEL